MCVCVFHMMQTSCNASYFSWRCFSKVAEELNSGFVVKISCGLPDCTLACVEVYRGWSMAHMLHILG